MIPVSDKFKEIMASNIRPKCEPIIKISGIDNNGNQTTITWQAKDIKSMTFKRGIDPIGRELPYMELSWTEIYKGKLNAESYPEKYENIIKYMAVELSFVQYLSFFNTWKTLFDTNKTWKNLFVSSTTWKQLKNNIETEIVTMPKMYLSARPIVEGSTIKWVAKDILSFLDEQVIKAFDGVTNTIPFVNPLRYLILNSRTIALNSPELFEGLNAIDNGLQSFQEENSALVLDKPIIFNGSVKNHLKNYASLFNMHWNFTSAHAVIKDFSNRKYTEFLFSKKIMPTYPSVANGTNISSYSFKNYVLEKNESQAYKKEAYENIGYEHNDGTMTYVHKYNYDNYGTSADVSAEEIDKGIIVNTTLFEPDYITVIPINYTGYDNSLSNNKVGEVFSEDNPINPYDSASSRSSNRLVFLDEYFNDTTKTLEFNSLAVLHIEPGDMVDVDTNLYYSASGVQVRPTATVVAIEITYNGSLKEKVIAHTEAEKG